jgi:hypothetical protein
VPAAHATVTTSRPSRYLTQLCQHVAHLGRRTDRRPHRRQGDPEHTPPGTHAQVTWSDNAGVIDLGWGRCTLTTVDNTLVLHAEACDDTDLHLLQALLSARLHQFGRRDHLTVTWQPSPTPTPAPAAAADRSPDVPGAKRRRPRRGTVILVTVGVLVVALHLGLGAAVIAAPAWTGWALDAVLAVVVVKLLASIVLGRRLIHHRRRSSVTAPETSDQPRG